MKRTATKKAARFIYLALMACVSSFFNLHAETVIYSEGFEANNGGYTHVGANDTWQWGTPFSSFTRGPASAHSGVACWGTNLGGDVPYNSEAYLSSPSISLPALGANQVMRIRFFGWIAIDYMFDRGEFQVSKDGVNWETKAELFCIMQGGWNEYTFDISDYAGGNIFLRFMCRTDDQDYFDPPPYNMAGLYVDDIAITAIDAPATKTTLTFSGWESQDEIASCPNIFSWKDSAFVKDNDIFSTAWGAPKEYTDYYQLRNVPRVVNGKYVLYLAETNLEVSFIDLLHLIVVDHVPNMFVATDDSGNICNYLLPKQPQSATDKAGNDVLPLTRSPDGIGYRAYNGDSVVFDFSNCTIGANANLIVRATGYKTDTASGTPTYMDRPELQIQTKNIAGAWTTRTVFYPRMLPAVNGFDLHKYFVYDKKVRVVSVSCLTGKYHLIDYVGLALSAKQATTVTELVPLTAIRSDSTNIASLLANADGLYAQTIKGQRTLLAFDIPTQQPNTTRDFIIKSKGYFVPTGTFFFYTWDGSNWVQRDGWTAPDVGDQTRTFDLSQWLPDPSGDYKVRIWQDFIFNPAGINFVGLTRDGVKGVMSYATDLMGNASILDAVKDSDAVSADWDWGMGWPDRNRWVEIGWTGFPSNHPPTTNPVTVANVIPPFPTIFWTYRDIDNDPQVNAAVEVWTGPNGTGSNIWNPATLSGPDTSVVYAGQALTNGQIYYARVKAFDGAGWGGWSECAFVYAQNINQPPFAEAGPAQNLPAGAGCSAQVTLDGSGSFDPDGDPLSYTWTGPFGTVTGMRSVVTLSTGIDTIRLVVDDGKGGVAQDSVIITISDKTPPVPDVSPLPDISGTCSVTIPARPTATDNCDGQIVGATLQSLTYSRKGVYTVEWKYVDHSNNATLQTQTVIVNDTDPVPDVSPLPVIKGYCQATVTGVPTATSACVGTINGTTTDSLTFFNQGTHYVVWKYDDARGNVSRQIQAVIVKDTIKPVPDIIPLPIVKRYCSATITTTPTATDNCTGKIFGTTADPLTYANQGVYTVTWNYDDGNGNVSTQKQIVIVKDTITPVPDVSSLPTITGSCSATIPGAPTATDNCVGKVTGTTADPLTYSVQGTYTVTWNYNDGNGNVATQTQTVIVSDITPPVPDVSSLPTITGSCSATIPCAPTATDNCSGHITGTTSDPLTYSTQGSHTVTWKYTDASGNTATQTQTVIVSDITPPVPDVSSLPTITGSCSATIPSAPTATDNCSGHVTGTTTDPLTYTTQGSHTVTWKYTDASGNTATQTQTVIVSDITPPVPDVSSLPTITGSCSATIPSTPTATDNCSGHVTGTTTDPLMYTTQGSHTVTWKYTDASENTTTQTQTVVVSDVTPPVPDVSSLPTITGSCSATIPSTPTATDNCSGKVTGTTNDLLTYTTQGSNTVTWKYTDASGNTATQTQTVIVSDVTPPVPDVSSLPTITGSCSATIPSAPTATDNCSGKITGTTNDPLTYTTQGSHTVTWKYIDASGNVATQTQTVIVSDVTPPVPDVLSLPTITGSCSATIPSAPTATDNCKGKITGTTTNPLSYTAQGTYTVTWKYDDGNGNSATQTQTVIVKDNIAPVPDISSLPTITGTCSATITSAPTATDNCSGKITGTTSDPLTYTTQGSHTVTWKYTDASGNVATQTQTVIVSDITPPVPDVSSLPTITGSCSATIPSAPTATDNCKGKITGTTTNPLSYTAQGTYTVTWKYDDGNGNSATQTQTVIVRDNVAPVPDISSLPTITGTCSATITSAPTATDNCKGKITGTTTSPLTYTAPGTYSVTWKYDDGNGNIASQTQTVTVISGPCCTIPTDSAYNYSILAKDYTWSGTGTLNAGTSSIRANGQITMSGTNTFKGNVFASTRFISSGTTTINGNAKAPTFTTSGVFQVTGTKTIGPVPQIPIPNIDLTPYSNWAIAKGTVYNGNLIFSGTHDTIIPGGVLWVNGSITVSGSFKVVGCIIATGDITFSGQGDLTRAGSMPALVSVNGNITMSGAGKITGLIYAKNGGLTKSGSGEVVGSLICKGNFTKSGSWATLTYTKFLPMPPGCN